jgi:hypothetical protein
MIAIQPIQFDKVSFRKLAYSFGVSE